MRARLAVATACLLLAGCGTDPGSATETLTDHLADVDAASVAGDPAALDVAVGDLLDAVTAAESSGDLESAQARRIRAAARALLAVAEPAEEPTDRKTTKPPEAPEDGSGEDSEGDSDDD